MLRIPRKILRKNSGNSRKIIFSGKFLRKVKIRAIFRGFWRKNGAFSFRKIIFRKLLCSCIFLLSSKRQSPLSSHLSPFPLIPPPKTENQKAEKKEKIEKIKKKKRQNFLRFFPVAPLPLFHKKEFKRKEKKKKTFSISLSFPTPKEEKRVERRRKETKEKEKEEKKER